MRPFTRSISAYYCSIASWTFPSLAFQGLYCLPRTRRPISSVMDLLITYFVLSSRSLWYPRATIILSLNHSRWLAVVPLDDFRSSLRNPAHRVNDPRSALYFMLRHFQRVEWKTNFSKNAVRKVPETTVCTYRNHA